MSDGRRTCCFVVEEVSRISKGWVCVNSEIGMPLNWKKFSLPHASFVKTPQSNNRLERMLSESSPRSGRISVQGVDFNFFTFSLG